MGLKNKLSNIEQLFLVQKNIISSEESFKKTIEKNEFKTVQVLAMFITLATLTLSTVKAFENRDVHSAVILIFALTSGMLLINYLIYWFSRSDKKFDFKKDLVWIILISVSSIGSYWLSSQRQEEIVSQNYNLKVDSLRYQLMLKDSLLKWKDIYSKDTLKDKK